MTLISFTQFYASVNASFIYFKARNFRGMKISRFHGWDLKSAKLKCRQKYFFSSTAKLKCNKMKFLDQNVKLKCREKKPLKIHLWKNNATKMQFLCFAFLERNKLEIFFWNHIFISGWKKKQTWQPQISQTGTVVKKHCSETRRSMVQTVKIYVNLFMLISTRENSFHCC